MAAISVTKIIINSVADPRTETYIFTAEKNFSYANIKQFLYAVPFAISNSMLRDGESIQTIKSKNLQYDSLFNQTSTYTGISSIVLLNRSANYTATSTQKEISFPLDFSLIDGDLVTTDFKASLGIYLEALNGVVVNDYNIKTMSIIYRGEE